MILIKYYIKHRLRISFSSHRRTLDTSPHQQNSTPTANKVEKKLSKETKKNNNFENILPEHHPEI